MRRWGLSAWYAICAFACLSGCSSGPSSKKVVIRISGWAAAGDGSDAARIEREVYEDFEKTHPGIEIQLENIPGSQDYVRKILLSFVAHSEPDVMKLDASSAAVFINNGVLADLQPQISSSTDFKIDDFYPNVVDIARRGDKLYAVPIDFTPMVVYYNKRLFDEGHVPYPKEGWTWADFLTTAKALTKQDQYGFTFTNWMPGWLPWVWNNGGDVVNASGTAAGTADHAKTAEAVAYLRDLINKEKVAPSLSQMAAEGAAPFANATAAMEISGHWNLMGLASAPRMKLSEVGVSPLPVARAGQAPVTVIYEAGWAIGKNCKHPKEAWEFIRYFTSQEVQRKFQKTGVGVCARKDISLERAVDEREKEFLRIVPSGRRPWGATIEGYDFVESEGQKMMDGVLKSGREPKEALHEFAVAVDRQLGQK